MIISKEYFKQFNSDETIIVTTNDNEQYKGKIIFTNDKTLALTTNSDEYSNVISYGSIKDIQREVDNQMEVSRDIRLKVSKSEWNHYDYYRIDENVTILLNDDKVLEGQIKHINKWSLTLNLLNNDNSSMVMIRYDNIKDIANTNWLAGTDIRDK